MERKFYVAKKDCYDALSYDTLVKACAAAGLDADGLVQFSRFEIDGLSDDGFEKCKGLFYDAFSDELYENELDMGDAKIFAFDGIRRDDERLESAVKIACGETVVVKSAKIVAAYGLKDEDREVFENYTFYFKNQSKICPSMEIVTTRHGRNFPLACSAFFAAISKPPQQGTSMRTMVTSLISLFRMMSVSFSL